MTSDAEIIITFLYKRSGKDELSFSDLYLNLSMELNWFTPDDAKAFVNTAIKQELLIKKGDLIKPNFDYNKIAKYTKQKVEELMNNKGIIRNTLKIESVISNAKAFLNVQKEFGSFNNYIWKFVNYKTIDNKFKDLSELPSKTEQSEQMSKDLKKRRFKFVGPTICYAFMQAVGMVNDHVINCFRYEDINKIV